MIDTIEGLHHVTALAADAQRNNDFFTGTLGLRRVKKTVNFDAPDVYHLYYGDRIGSPGTVMTYFPFPDIGPRKPGAGEVAETQFSVPEGALPYWAERLARHGAEGLASDEAFGRQRLRLAGPDGEDLVLVEVPGDGRAPWGGADVPEDAAIRGFAGARLRASQTPATEELLAFMGYAAADRDGAVTRYARAGGNGADGIEIEAVPHLPPARQGAGSVHHIAFAVRDRAAQAQVRAALAEAGHRVTPVIDRDYFFAIYFRTPGGVLFEVATGEPGFTRDEDEADLGAALRLPAQHAHLRERLERTLPPIRD